MLQRILEVEVMDRPDEAADYDAMDHTRVNDLFVADLLRFASDFQQVLDVGTGTAQIPIALCLRHPRVCVMALDMAESMLRLGQTNVQRAGLSERVQLRHGDAKHLPMADNTVEAVMSNSIVHHIPGPAGVLAEMVRVVQPGGILFVRDLMRPDNQAVLDRIVEQYAGDANRHQQQMFADSLYAALTLDEMRALIRELGFAEGSVQSTSDRHWTWSARKPGQDQDWRQSW